MTEIIKKILIHTLTNDDNKFSHKKLTTLVFVIFVGLLHITYIYHLINNKDYSNFIDVLIVDVSYVAVSVGLNVYLNSNRIKTINGNAKKDNK